MKKDKVNKYVLILAGGNGTRLWPISIERKPKQFLKLYGNEIMINETIQRVKKIFSYENIFIIVNEKQIELANFVKRISDKGAMVVVSNSDPKNANEEDDFFDKIYAIHKIKRVEATRMINCNSDSRGKIKELLISNF